MFYCFGEIHLFNLGHLSNTLYSSYIVACMEFWVSSKSNIYFSSFFIINLLLRKEINDNIFVYKNNHNQDSKLKKIFEIFHYVAGKF